MKVCIIKASAASGFKKYKKSRGGLPQNIFCLASATPRDIEVELIDETIDYEVNYSSDADLVAIMFSTPDAMRAYKHGDLFKKLGKTVVMGGLHASFLPDEALKHCDAVMIGESEPVWTDVLKDFQNHSLKERYEAAEAFDLADLKPFRKDLIPLEYYDYVWTVIVSRGCPNKCEFCTVNKFFKKQTYRPIANIIEEIKNCGTKYVELKADNLTVDRDYCLELFKALKPLQVSWSTLTALSFTEDEELLAAAVESGLSYVLVGIESVSEQALKRAGKGFVTKQKIIDGVEKFHQYGVVVDSLALFGFDSDTPDIFEKTFEFYKEIGVDVSDSAIITPYPGTSLFKRLDDEGRILTHDWAKYDGSYAVYQPASMSVEDLEYGAYWFNKKWYSRAERLERNKRMKRYLSPEDYEYVRSSFIS